MSKKNETDWTTNIIIVGITFLVFFAMGFFFIAQENQNDLDDSYEPCSKEYTLCGGSCYFCQEGYYLGDDCECHRDDETLYRLANEGWEEHVIILNNDVEKANIIINQYCSNGMSYEQIPNCVNNLQPRLETYANHITNAQNFLLNKGDVFSNKQTLLAGLDDRATYVVTNANNLNQLTIEYNSWVQAQNYQSQISQQREQAIYDTIRILSGFI